MLLAIQQELWSLLKKLFWGLPSEPTEVHRGNLEEEKYCQLLEIGNEGAVISVQFERQSKWSKANKKTWGWCEGVMERQCISIVCRGDNSKMEEKTEEWGGGVAEVENIHFFGYDSWIDASEIRIPNGKDSFCCNQEGVQKYGRGQKRGKHAVMIWNLYYHLFLSSLFRGPTRRQNYDKKLVQKG